MQAKQVLTDFLISEGMSEALATATIAELVSDDDTLTADQAQGLRQWLTDNRAECMRNVAIGFEQAKAQHLDGERRKRLKKNRNRRR